MEDLSQQLPMFLYRKVTFKSEREENGHTNMLKGFRHFLDKNLRQDGSCAVMENDVVSTLFAMPSHIYIII